MKKLFLLFALTAVFASCKKEFGQIHMKTESDYGLRLHKLKISSKDTVVYEPDFPFYLMKGEFAKIDSLPAGRYQISYLDVLGKTKIDEIIVSGGDTIIVKPNPELIDVKPFYNKAPVSNIKNGQHYIIRKRGGCVAVMEGRYAIYNEGGQIFCQAGDGPKIKLDENGIKAVRQFEAELLAIEGVKLCMSTGRMTYSLIKDKDTIQIVDNTCLWHGWETMFSKLHKD